MRETNDWGRLLTSTSGPHTFAQPHMYPHTATHACTHTHRPWSHTHIRRKEKYTLCKIEKLSSIFSICHAVNYYGHTFYFTMQVLYGTLLLVFKCLLSQRNFLTKSHIFNTIFLNLFEWHIKMILHRHHGGESIPRILGKLKT